MQTEIKKAIRDLLTERNAVLLAHNYMRDEIQEIADITGDSLGLSQEASKASAAVIVFCGVHFMAESAAILSPEKNCPVAASRCRLPHGGYDHRRGTAELQERPAWYPGCHLRKFFR